MKPLFPRNISNTGRFVRALVAVFDWLFVRRDVERIFQYRQQRLKDIFASTANASRKSSIPECDSAAVA